MITVIQPYSQGTKVDIFDHSVEDIQVSPTDPDARWTVRLTGKIEEYDFDFGAVEIGTWLLSGVNSDYEIRATEVSQSGSATRTGTLNTWMAMSSDRTWRITKTSGTGVTDWVLDMEIRPAGGGANLDTCRITLTAERTL
jgi:hypothetical protein